MNTALDTVTRTKGYFRLKSWFRLLLLCVLTGIVAGLGALAFDHGLKFLESLILHNWLFQLDPSSSYWLLAIVPALGGALSGGLAWWLAPEATGHGTDTVIRAFHRNRAEIRARVPVVKGLCSILTIGSGGSAGKEGPIAQIGAGFGSTLAKILHLSIPDRRILMLAGVAGGIGAIFKAPLGGALFAAEVLYREPDFEHDAVIPSIISSVTAYSVFTSVDGHNRILQFIDQRTNLPFTPEFPSPGGSMLVELLHYAALSLLCAIVAYLFTKSLVIVERKIFKPLQLPLPRISKPALGGVALGVLAIVLMLGVDAFTSNQPNVVLGTSRPEHIMAGGHLYLQTVVNSALDPNTYDFWTSFKLAGFLGAVVLAKILASSFTIGSGGSGGLLFPALFLGGVTGAAYSKLLRALSSLHWLPNSLIMTPNQRAGMILVGMGGVFAACTKTPIASLVMVSEITGSYGLLVPLMMTCASAYLLSHSFTMNEEQVPGIADSPAHQGEFLVNILEDMKVSDAMVNISKSELIPASMPYKKVMATIRGCSSSVFPIVDENECLIGMFSLTDLRQIMHHEMAVSGLLVAGDLGSSETTAIYQDTTLDKALRLLTSRNSEAIPVVLGSEFDLDSGKGKSELRESRKLIGMLYLRNLIAAYHRKIHDIQVTDNADDHGSRVFDDALESDKSELVPDSEAHSK